MPHEATSPALCHDSGEGVGGERCCGTGLVADDIIGGTCVGRTGVGEQGGTQWRGAGAASDTCASSRRLCGNTCSESARSF